MTLAQRFRTAVSQSYEEVGGELLPVLLSQACVTVLPMAGAGVSLIDELRDAHRR